MISFPKLSLAPSDLEYFWYNLPFAIPGIFTFVVGLLLAILALLAIKRTPDKRLLITFILFSFGFSSLGLTLALRSLVQDLETLLFWNRVAYYGVVWLSPGALLFTYFMTDRVYRSLLIAGLLSLGTVFYAYYALMSGHDFSGRWFHYSFGIYPIADLPLRIWGAVASLGYILAGIPISIHYITKKKERASPIFR